MLIAAISEVITIGSVVPLVSVILGGEVPSFISNLLGYVFSNFETGNPGNNNFLTQLIIGFICLIVLSTITSLIAQYSMINFTNNMGFDLTNRVYENVLLQKYEYHVKTNSSEILATVNKVQSIMGGVIAPVLQAVSSGIMAIGIVIFLLVLNWQIAITTFLTITLTYTLISIFVQKKLDANSVIVSKAHSDRVLSINEALGNIRELILGDRHNQHYRNFLKSEIYLKNASIENAFISAAPKLVIEGIGIIVLLFAAFFLSSSDGRALDVLPTIAAFAFATQKLLPSLQSIFAAWSRLMGNLELIKDILVFLRLPVLRGTSKSTEVRDFFLLRMTDVDFSHDSGLEVLRNVNVEINCGEIIGIIGETGSGKSTFVDLLSELIQPTAGSIEVFSANERKLNTREWQNNIAYVPQNPYFLDKSILSNICLNDKIDKQEQNKIDAIISVSQLESVIDNLKDGISSIIGERGGKLSGGQLQRVAIARALYANKNVLILDEATSALDPTTEKALLVALKNEFKNKTVILITHRPKTLEFCDKVFELRNKNIWQL